VTLMTMRGYARHRGVSEAAVRRAVEACRISKREDGLIDQEQADREWTANTKPADSGVAAPSVGAEFAQSRAKREKWKARQAEYEVRRLRGQLIEVDAVREAAFAVHRAARDQLLALPDRLAAVLAGTTDADECHRILTGEIDQVCRELAKPIAGAVPDEPTPQDGSDQAAA
jgi:hypothetical protein